VISGVATGKATEHQDVIEARKGAPDAPLLIGSGITAENIASYLPVIDGALVGTYFKVDGRVDNAVDVERVKALVAAKHG
jgi:uncharacterized protein